MVSEVTSESATPADRRYLKSGYVALPTWRGVAAGAEDEDYFMDPDYPEFREVSSFLVSDPDSHVLCIPEGDSMSPRINERERAIVRLDPDVPAGYLVAARSPEGRTYIKRLVRVDGKRELRSINPNFEPITNLRGWDLRGGVIAILKDVEPGQPNMEYDDGRYLRA
jgi:phage repressor protein C with HTH and peptisase S24 domain